MSGTEVRTNSRSSLAIAGITLLNSFATGILWNGLGFVTERQYGYTKAETLLLYIGAGAIYTVAAFWSGRLVRSLRQRMSPRAIMGVLFVVQTLVAPLAFWRGTSAGVMIVALVTSATGAVLWPIVEAYVGGGRSAEGVRKSVGRWCLLWMASVAAVLILMAPLTDMEGWFSPRMALGAIAPMSLASILCLLWVTPAPPPHCEEHEPAPVEYKAHLASVRIILPASYLLVGALSPLMPYVLTQLQLPAERQTPLTAIWLLARLGVVAILARVEFWHGRRGALLCGAIGLAGGFALVVGVSHISAIVIGLVLFGAGHGIIYYAALYYALRVGSAQQVDAGSIHEALIGSGYVVGPAAALAGAMMGGGGWTVGIIWIVLGLVAIPAYRPYLKMRASARTRS